MFKKVTVFALITLLFIAFSVSFATVKQEGKLVRLTANKYAYQDGQIQHRLSVLQTENGKVEVVDTLYWYDPAGINGAMPYTFPGDTIVEDFKLIPDPAFLLKVRGVFGDGGLANFYVTDQRVDPSTGDVLTGFGPTILANVPWNVTGNPPGQLSWEELDFTPNPGVQDTIFLPWSNNPDPAMRPNFVIGYVCSGTGGNQGDGVPDIYYDFNDVYTPDGPRGHSWFTYGGVGWYGIRYSGNQAWAQYVFEVVVDYFNGTSPFINNVTQLNDTWFTTNFHSVTADLVDIDGTIVDAWLLYQKNDMPVDSVAPTSISGDTYYFDIPGSYSPGDSITYWVKVTDNDNKTVVGAKKYFRVLAPQNPGAEVLVVFNGLFADEQDLPSFWEPVLNSVLVDSLGKSYETWDIEEHRGIDESVLDYSSFQTALVVGFSVNTIPYGDYSTSVWKNFVDSGKNLFVASSDYLFSNGLSGPYTAQPGDFLKDVLGVGDVVSDPDDGAANSTGDQYVIGVTGDPVSDPWAVSPLIFNFDVLLAGSNWNDYASADAANPNAVTVFTGVVSGQGNGVRNVNSMGGATLFLPFNLSAIVDSTVTGDPIILNDAYKLLNRYFQWVIATDINDPVNAPLSYELKPNYPNPFNPSTTIEYAVKERSRVTLTIYNTLGEKVRTLVNDVQAPNRYTVKWNGTNDSGAKVASGVYIYKLTAGDFTATHKMILMK